MNRKRLYNIICCSLLITALAVTVWQFGSAAAYNHKIRDSFSYRYDSGLTMQYRDEVSPDEMDLSVYLNYFVDAMVGVKKTNIILPCDISYYTEDHGEKVKAFTITKGTEVRAQARESEEDLLSQAGYGVWGFPTYDTDWRYVRAFSPVSQEIWEADQAYYYVKTEDLKAAAHAMLQTDSSYRNMMQQQGQTEEEAANELVFSIDQVLYDEGIWCSPALLRPMWTLRTIIPLGITLLLWALLGALLKAGKIIIACRHARCGRKEDMQPLL